LVGEKLDVIIGALRGDISKAAACHNTGVKRTTLIETLRVRWPRQIWTLKNPPGTASPNLSGNSRAALRNTQPQLPAQGPGSKYFIRSSH
jgi:hypothetical protein